MEITLGGSSAVFQPWRPEDGRVIHSAFAFDTETTLIDNARPWITPAYVIGAAFDGSQGYFVQREDAADFLLQHDGLPIVMHHAPFDLAVLDVLIRRALRRDFDVYRCVDRHLVWDTQLLHRLLTLGTQGHTAFGSGQSTLETCTALYLNTALPKTTRDSVGDDVRLSYDKWLNKSLSDIDPVYLQYLAMDSMATFGIYRELDVRLHDLLTASNQVWGHVSPEWMAEQIKQWGPQTHHIQLKAAIVLREITANGLRIDLNARGELVKHLEAVAEELRHRLRQFGYIPDQPGSSKAEQDILKWLERKHPGLAFPRTATGKFRTTQDALDELAAIEPFVRDYLDFKTVRKLLSSFLGKMGRQRLHPSFDPLLVTGRTSSYGEINAQNLPRDDRIRSCFTASPGHVLIIADYSTVELATLAQAVQSQFQLPSQMAAAINQGRDLHRLVASHITGKPEAEVTDEERRMAKAINFGKPGGMGEDGLRQYAKSSNGIEMTDKQVADLSAAWSALFPEMQEFLSHGRDLGESVARMFKLTPLTCFDSTGSRKFLDHPDNRGRGDSPHHILGRMCLKVIGWPAPETKTGKPYTTAEIDYFWASVQEKSALLPASHRRAVAVRQPSPELQRAIVEIAKKSPCFTLTGRLRANAAYCARHNTLFQGLAADGAKLALWRLWRAGYRIVNFIHDEVLIEVPEQSNLGEHAEAVRRLMIDGMQQVVPDVRIEVEYAAARCWSKRAQKVFDDQGQLVPWEPANDSLNATAPALPPLVAI